jgi:hypothetical protein
MVQRKTIVGPFQHHFVGQQVQLDQLALMEKMVRVQLQLTAQPDLLDLLDLLDQKVIPVLPDQKVTQEPREQQVQLDLLDQEVEVPVLKVTRVQPGLPDLKVILEQREQCNQ